LNTQKGAQAKFSELFINTAIFLISTAKLIALLFDNRQSLDYDFDDDPTEIDAQAVVANAKEILQMAKMYFHAIRADVLPDPE
jgi:uncharacterized protein (UPF0332 family)